MKLHTVNVNDLEQHRRITYMSKAAEVHTAHHWKTHRVLQETSNAIASQKRKPSWCILGPSALIEHPESTPNVGRQKGTNGVPTRSSLPKFNGKDG
jgi:hypothetical protein